MKYIFGFFILVGIGFAGWLFTLYEEIKDDVKKVIEYKPKLSTQFYDKNGKLIANTFKDENREYVKYDDIPARIIEGLIAIEDTHFFEHRGINPDAISRAMIKNIKAGGYVEGASTLTQQLVKMLVLSREKKLIRKIKEALLSLRLETLLTKEEILERYLNHVYFGHGYYGIKTASRGYFKKELYELSLKEMAILVGLPRAPSFYDPTKNLKISLARANQVISRLNTLGWINKDQYENSITETPIIHNQTLTQNKAPYVIDYVIKKLRKDIPDIKYGGYKVKLTIDLNAQDIAREGLKLSYEDALKRDLSYREKENTLDDNSFIETLNGAVISINSNTGKILAMVGGVDYKASMYNRAVQSKRQPGSSIKPFLYQTALNEGFNPLSNLVDISRTYDLNLKKDEKDKTEEDETKKFKDFTQEDISHLSEEDFQILIQEDKKLEEFTKIALSEMEDKKFEKLKKEIYDKKWKPKNYGGKYKGLISLRDSLAYSRNLSTINLVTDIGINTMHKSLLHYGFKDIPKDLSITLGAMSTSLLELSEYYSFFANQGTQVKPYIVEQIINKNNEVVNFMPNTKEINSPEQTYLVTSILHDTVKRGTGKRARVSGIELAGKTGTTNDNKDAWFCGYSPSIQTIVWFGNDNNKPMRKSETGGKIAAPVFSHFYKNYLKIHPEIQRKFIKPENIFVSKINGKKEYYTKTSPLPEIEVPVIENENSNIEF
jgi:penicillin-binding protein 1A